MRKGRGLRSVDEWFEDDGVGGWGGGVTEFVWEGSEECFGNVRGGGGGRGVGTLRASLSSTFLQTLPDLVTPLKGHSLSPRSCPPTWSAPFEMFGY